MLAFSELEKANKWDAESYLKVFAEVTITEVLKENGKVAGVYGYRRENGNEVLFEAPAAWNPYIIGSFVVSPSLLYSL